MKSEKKYVMDFSTHSFLKVIFLFSLPRNKIKIGILMCTKELHTQNKYT